MPRLAVLPGNSGLARLFDETLQTQFSGAQQFGIAALDESGQEHEKGAIAPRRLKHVAHDRIGGLHTQGGYSLALRIIQAELEMLWVIEEPGGRNAEGLGEGHHDRDRGVRLSGFDGLHRCYADTGFFCEGGDGQAPHQAPGLDGGSNGGFSGHGAHSTEVILNPAIIDEVMGLS